MYVFESGDGKKKKIDKDKKDDDDDEVADWRDAKEVQFSLKES